MAEDGNPNITTTQSIETGPTVVQKVDPVSGEVTQEARTGDPLTATGGMEKAPEGESVGTIHEAAMVEGAVASANPVPVPDQVDTALDESQGPVDKQVALQRAKLQSHGLSTFLNNVAGHAGMDVKELSARVESLMAALRHLI